MKAYSEPISLFASGLLSGVEDCTCAGVSRRILIEKYDLMLPVEFPRQARSRETRARIAEAAKQLFSINAYQHVKLRQIAELAQRTTSSIFQYWPDKAALWRSVMASEPPIDSPLTRTMPGITIPGILEAHERLRRGLAELRSAIEEGQPSAHLVEMIDALLGDRGAQAPSILGRDGGGAATGAQVDEQAAGGLATEKLIGARIRHKRRSLGLSQVDLAEVLNISIQQVGRYESGASHLPAGRLAPIAERLGCAVSDLLSGPTSEPQGRRPWVRRRRAAD